MTLQRAQRVLVAWLPGGPAPVIRVKDESGLREWAARRWTYFPRAPLVADVTDSFLALGPERAEREAARAWLLKPACDRLSAFLGALASETNPAYVSARDEVRRVWRHTPLWFRPAPAPVVVLDPAAPGDVEVRPIEADLAGALLQYILFPRAGVAEPEA